MPQNLESDILDLLHRYLNVPTDTDTALETHADGFIRKCLGGEPYFRDNPAHLGTWPIPDDTLDRTISWALVRGSAPATVVLIHHSDTVGTDDYRHLAPSARNPAALAAALKAGAVPLAPEVREDLDSGAFLFGHGAADMKGGAAIHLALLKRFAREPGPRGSVLLLCLPAEESVSLGARNAPLLLDDLRRRFGLDYRLMLNAEPHMRSNPALGVLSEGSMGKVMPFIYVRGAVAHSNQVFTGLNPVRLLCEMVRRIDLDPGLCDRSGAEVTIPPSCLFLKDSKVRYDVSLPRSAFACFNFLSLGRTPAELLGLLERTCAEAVQHVLGEVDRSHASWQRQRNEPATALPWSVPVLRFDQLSRSGAAAAGPDPVLARVLPKVQDYSETMAQATWEVVEGMLDRGAGPQGPVVVLGYVPPYYPGVTNAAMGETGRGALDLAEHLVRFATETLGQPYTREPFYHIVCDLSYASVQGGDDLERTLFANMPLNGPAYGIPFPAIRANAMPGLNIGPFGKDFHQLTERVHRRDLLEITPKLIQEAIRVVMEQA